MNFRDPATLQPELYVRMPKPKRRFQGMCRTTLQQLGDAGLIQVISVQQPGCIRGIKLIYLPSLFEYLDGLRANELATFAARSGANNRSVKAELSPQPYNSCK